MKRKPAQLNNGNFSLVGYIVRNTDTGLVADDGFGHFKVYASAQSAKRKAGYLNNSPVNRITTWKVFPVNTIISSRSVK